MVNAKQFRAWLTKRNQQETLEKIAEDFGVHFVSVYRWISGERNPAPSILKLAERVMKDQASR